MRKNLAIAIAALFSLSLSGNVFAETKAADDEWHFAAVVLNRTTQMAYIYVDPTNSQETVNGSISGMGNPDSEPGVPFQIGRRGTRINEFFDGPVDEVRVYNRALSSNEVYALYQGSFSPWLSVSPTSGGI